jgi:hypothetical protein
MAEGKQAAGGGDNATMQLPRERMNVVNAGLPIIIWDGKRKVTTPPPSRRALIREPIAVVVAFFLLACNVSVAPAAVGRTLVGSSTFPF